MLSMLICLLAVKDEGAPTIAYVRVSRHNQKADLDRRREVLAARRAAKGWRTQIIRDLDALTDDERKETLKRLSIL